MRERVSRWGVGRGKSAKGSCFKGFVKDVLMWETEQVWIERKRSGKEGLMGMQSEWHTFKCGKESDTLLSACVHRCSVGTHNLELPKQLVPPEKGNLLPPLGPQHKSLQQDTNQHGHTPQECQNDHSERQGLQKGGSNANSECQKLNKEQSWQGLHPTTARHSPQCVSSSLPTNYLSSLPTATCKMLIVSTYIGNR